MGIETHNFPLRTDTGGDQVLTGSKFFGAITQISFDGVPLGGDTGLPDTGATITVRLQPGNILVGAYGDMLGARSQKAPRQAAHDTGGAPISGVHEYVYSNGHSLEVTLDAANGAGKSGTLTILSVS